MGIVKFKSKAGADVIMLTQHATVVFSAMGLALSTQGAVEPSQLAVCLQRLEQVLLHEANQANPANPAQQLAAPAPQASLYADDDPPPEEPINLRLRSQPLRQLFEQALHANMPVYWGF